MIGIKENLVCRVTCGSQFFNDDFLKAPSTSLKPQSRPSHSSRALRVKNRKERNAKFSVRSTSACLMSYFTGLPVSTPLSECFIAIKTILKGMLSSNYTNFCPLFISTSKKQQKWLKRGTQAHQKHHMKRPQVHNEPIYLKPVILAQTAVKALKHIFPFHQSL